jgi:hypothetical protein
MPSPLNPLLDRPIIVVGAPRSGTTFLGQLLGQHPSLAHLEEPRLTWRYGNDAKCDMFAPEDARPEICDRIRAAFANCVRNSRKERLIEKTPSNSLRMGFVERVLPGCLFVHIIRDGIESSLAIRRFWEAHAHGVPREKLWARIKEMRLRQAPHYARELMRRIAPRGLVRPPVWGPRIPGIDGLLQDLSLLEVSALQWRTCVEAARQYGSTLAPDRYFECRLEEMSPELIARLLNFCQLSDAPEVWEAYEREFHPAQTSHRRAAASPEELTLLKRWLDPTLQWLGYCG